MKERSKRCALWFLHLCFPFLKCGYYEACFQMCYNYGERKGGRQIHA
nr:MAG TPA: hypothetical protein [Caudoviricetes sp.]